jgi:8-oxo-dGTP diphosphatase
VNPDPAAAVTGPLVGVSAIVARDGAVLLGRRRGAHGAGTFAFPGGKPDPGEHPSDTVRRELLEETGLTARSIQPVAWTSDVFADGDLHFVTLHHVVEADGEPEVREPDKVEAWGWYAWGELPEPLFAPAASLIASGWHPASQKPR